MIGRAATIKGAKTNHFEVEKDAPSSERYRVAFISGSVIMFITGIQEKLSAQHEVRAVSFPDKVHLDQIQEAMNWADIAWFEWCDLVLIQASKKLKKTCKVICRLHSYEVFSNYPNQVS